MKQSLSNPNNNEKETSSESFKPVIFENLYIGDLQPQAKPSFCKNIFFKNQNFGSMTGIPLRNESGDFGLKLNLIPFPGGRAEISSTAFFFFLRKTEVVAWAYDSKPILH